MLLILSSLLSEPASAVHPDQSGKQQALDAIPFDRLNEEAQAKLWEIVSHPSMYRQLPVTVIDSDPDLYRFLVRYPEVVVNMWQLMGVTKVDVQRTGDFTFNAADGAGTTCNVDLVYGDDHTHIYYAEGAYEGVLLRRLIRGRCVMVLQSAFAETEDLRVYVTSRLDMFVQFDNLGAEILAKTIHPLIGKAADHNFTESTRFLGQVSEAAEKKSAGIQRLAERLENIDAGVRDRFTELALNANHRAAMRDARPEQLVDTPATAITPLLQGASAEAENPDDRKPIQIRR